MKKIIPVLLICIIAVLFSACSKKDSDTQVTEITNETNLIETVEEKPELYVSNEAFRMEPLLVTPAVAAPMILVFLIHLLIKYRQPPQKPPEKKEKEEEKTEGGSAP